MVGLGLVACSSSAPAPPPTVAEIKPVAAPRVAAEPIAGDALFGNYLAGRQARRERDLDAATLYFSRALEADPDNIDLLRQAYLALLADGRVSEARALAERLAEARPGEVFAGMTLAVDAFRRSDFNAARAELDSLPRQGYNMLMVPLLSAWTAIGQGRVDVARKDLEPLKVSEAFTVFREFHRAMIEDMAGDANAAEAAYLRALTAHTGNSYRLVKAFGSFYERHGRTKDAAKLYADYEKRAPGSLLFAEARKRLDTGGAPAPALVGKATDGAAEALYGVASALYRENAIDAALLYDRLALYLRPRHAAAQALVGQIYEALNQPARALAAYDKVPASSPLKWSVRLRRANDLDALGRTDEAIAALRKMSDERPDRSDALIALGDLLRGKERWLESITAYDRAIGRITQFERRHWRPLYARAISLERAKQWPRAEADFLKALDLAPNQPFVLNYLGYSWVDKGANLDRALKMIQRAVDLRPNDGFIVDSLGWAYYHLGRFEEAVTQLERAVELTPDDPTLNDHLGDAYWRVGRQNEARFQWRRALTLDPPDAGTAEKIQAKLRNGLVSGPVADGAS